MLTGSASRRRSLTDDVAARQTVWSPVDVGVPVLVVDTGQGRRRRRLHVVLADRKSGFPRWRQAVDHLTDYQAAGPGLHTLRQSTDHAQLAALSFQDNSEANRFLVSAPRETLTIQ